MGGGQVEIDKPMKLAVFSHKPCWISPASPSGYATDGGFPFQMRAISELFDETTLVVPVARHASPGSETPLRGNNLTIAALGQMSRRRHWRRLSVSFWLCRNAPVLLREMLRADAVHAPIPGDIGTFGMLLAFLLRKPLFVRHCGNWLEPRTAAEHFWRWFMERFAGNRNVMLATGGSSQSPSKNPNVRWIFSTSLRAKDLEIHRRPFPGQPPARLVIACRQQRRKGTGTLIRSLPAILQQFPEATLDVAGDGEALPEWKDLARAAGLADRVRFHGKLNHSEVLRLFRRSSLFCYPTSASEGFPKVVLEALACGLPVITTRVSVLPQLIGNGCGILLEDTAPEAVARAVHTCLDPERYRQMSQCALMTARHYSLEKWRDEIGACLRTAWGPLTSRA